MTSRIGKVKDTVSKLGDEGVLGEKGPLVCPAYLVSLLPK